MSNVVASAGCFFFTFLKVLKTQTTCIDDPPSRTAQEQLIRYTERQIWITKRSMGPDNHVYKQRHTKLPFHPAMTHRPTVTHLNIFSFIGYPQPIGLLTIMKPAQSNSTPLFGFPCCAFLRFPPLEINYAIKTKYWTKCRDREVYFLVSLRRRAIRIFLRRTGAWRACAWEHHAEVLCRIEHLILRDRDIFMHPVIGNNHPL